jgi:WD40 repeat protein
MWDGPAYIWDAYSGRQLAELNHIHTAYSYLNSVTDVSWSSDRRYLAGGFNTGIIPKTNKDGATYFVPGEAVAIWDAQTGRRYRILEANYEEVNSIDWSPNSALLAVSLFNKDSSSLYLWNTNDLSQSLASELPERKIDGRVSEVAWSPNGKMLAALLEDGTIVIWNFGKQ